MYKHANCLNLMPKRFCVLFLLHIWCFIFLFWPCNLTLMPFSKITQTLFFIDHSNQYMYNIIYTKSGLDFITILIKELKLFKQTHLIFTVNSRKGGLSVISN